MALLAGVALGVAALLLREGATPGLPGKRSLIVRATVAPRVHLFGDVILLRLRVLLDRRVVQPEAVRADIRFPPYQRIGELRQERRDTGELTELLYTARAHCLITVCAPADGRKSFAFPPARLLHSTFARQRVMTVRWPTVTVASRVSPGDLPRNAFERSPWRADVLSRADTSYRLRPGTLQVLLLGAGTVLLLLAGAIVLRLVVQAERPPIFVAPAEPRVTLLERALRLVEQASSNGHSEEQRKALELLAGELDRFGQHGLGARARELAWSEDRPGAQAVGTFTGQVREATKESANGYPIP